MNRRAVPLALATMVLMCTLSPRFATAQVQWRSATDQPPAAKSPAEVAADLATLAAGKNRVHVLARFAGPVTEADRATLAAAGVTLYAYVGDHSYFAAVATNEFKPQAAADVALLRSAEPIDRAMKLHPRLLADDPPSYSIVQRAAAKAAPDGTPSRPRADVPPVDSPDDIIAVYALFHPDVALVDVIALARTHAADVRDTLATVNGLVLELPRGRIAMLADADAVQWIEPPLPPLSIVNDSNRVITQADTVQAAPYSLDGAGVNVLVYDGGTARATHQDFGGRLSVRDSSGQITHATHVAATIGGSGAASGGQYRGMAPAVTIQSYGFQYSGGGIFLYTNPGDIESDYNQAINTYGVHISNNSIGTNTETNGFPCDIQGDYGVTDTVIDAIVRGSLGAPFRVVWANGNERQGSDCDIEGYGDYYSTAPPATAKNHITVGALNSNDDSMTSFSSWGPVDDGRLKPDVSAPGCQSGGDGGVTSASASSDTSYTAACGTSMASPTVCGLSALILQDFRAQFPGFPDPRNSTLKIFLAHNAFDRGNPGPDYQFGYGSVRVQDTIDFVRQGFFFESEVGQGGLINTSVTVPPGATQLKISLAWDDVPGTPNVVPALVNDLDLIVLSPDSVQAFPWTLDPLNPSASAVRTQADHVNNIEQVVVDNPQAGEWTVRIAGFNVPSAPQPFSICASHPLVPPAGVTIHLVGGPPAILSPDLATTFDLIITPVNETLVPGSAELHYRFFGGSFTTVPMTDLGGNQYQVTMPVAPCNSNPEFYFSVTGDTVGTVTNPPGGASSPYAAAVGAFVTLFEDDMETDLGWTVGAAGGIPDDNATTGIWERVDPIGTAAQPEDDHTPPPGVMCWVTGQGSPGGGLGENDVDGGKTTLVSPIIDLSDGDAVISYWRWYSNTTGAAPNADVFTVDICNDGGASNTWINVETVGPSGAGTSGGWIYHEFEVGDFVTPTAQIRMRFVASDFGSGSLVEAALDDFKVDRFECVTAVPIAPTGVAASNGTFCDFVRVTWNASTGAQSYEVWRNTSSNSGTAAFVGSSTTTSFDDATATPGQNYFYWVKACGSGPCSGFSFPDTGSRAAPPAAPTGVSASDATACDISVTWNTVTGATSYEVWRNSVDDSGTATQIGTTGATSFVDSTATAATTWFYFVRAVGTCGASGYSASDAGSARVKGDFNGDGNIDGDDVQGFVDASLTPPFYDACADLAAPFGVLDAADQAAFVALLLAP